MDSSSSSSSSSSINAEVVTEFTGFLRVFNDGTVERFRGTVERFRGTDIVPAIIDPPNGTISSKDVTILSEPYHISARLFLPKQTLSNPNHKLPLLIYFHGGGFLISSPFNSLFHNYVSALVANSNILAVSVDYRLAPEHPIPAAYNDSSAALHWIAAHRRNPGPEPWLNHHADFDRVFLGGDSAGANIAHNLAMAIGNPDLESEKSSDLDLDLEILGVALVHPYFWGSDSDCDIERKAICDRLWPFVCPSNPDLDDPRVNPVADGAPSLEMLGCARVVVCVAEKDVLKEKGWIYYNALRRSRWRGIVEIYETQGEDYCFHLHDLGCEKAQGLIQCLADFFNTDFPTLV